MRHHTLWITGMVGAAAVSYTAYRASLRDIRGPAAVIHLYDRVSPVYDAAASVFRPLGARRLQERAVDLLDLQPGDTVVDLGCGTGVNLPILARAVGERGRVVGVDLSAGMLARARRRADHHGLPQVSLIRADIRSFHVPPGTSAVLATASLEMVPEYDTVVGDLAAQLEPTRGRLAVGGVRRPPAWPAWVVALGRTATAVFGVTRAYEDLQPWRSVRHHMDQITFETAAWGALYLIVAQAKPVRADRASTHTFPPGE
ncbi:MAG: methyltransferase domain-containing protein [Arachnia sp.]